MSAYSTRGEPLLVAEHDWQHPSLSLTDRDRLGYWLLVRLDDAAPQGAPVHYTELLPDIDHFEVRGAASWLVNNGYATWAPGSSIAITDLGHEAVGAVSSDGKRTRTES
jgi:hypothetical protein